MKTRIIRVINVPESDLKDIKAIAVALGVSSQSLYRDSFRYYVENHADLLAAGKSIMETQAALRKG